MDQVAALVDPFSTDPSDPFNVRRPDFDYAALSHHTEVFARILDNIPVYVAQEERKEEEVKALVEAASFTNDQADDEANDATNSQAGNEVINDDPLQSAASSSEKAKFNAPGLRLIESNLRQLSARISECHPCYPHEQYFNFL